MIHAVWIVVSLRICSFLSGTSEYLGNFLRVLFPKVFFSFLLVEKKKTHFKLTVFKSVERYKLPSQGWRVLLDCEDPGEGQGPAGGRWNGNVVILTDCKPGFRSVACQGRGCLHYNVHSRWWQECGNVHMNVPSRESPSATPSPVPLVQGRAEQKWQT